MDKTAGRIMEAYSKLTGRRSASAKGKAARTRGSWRTSKARAKQRSAKGRAKRRRK